KLVREALQMIGRELGIDLNTPFGKLPRKQRDALLLGGSGGKAGKFEGILPNLRRRFNEGSWSEQADLDPYRAAGPCPACGGQRLRPQSLSVKVKGRTIADYVDLPISEAVSVFDGLTLTDREAIIAERILREIQERLHFLHDVGVGYLTLGR